MENILKLSVYLMKSIPVLNIMSNLLQRNVSLFQRKVQFCSILFFIFLWSTCIFIVILLTWIKFTCNMQSKLEGQGFQEICFLQ
jgi:hypothetical protein